MAAISAMSSTVVHSRSFVAAVAARSPMEVSKEGFARFWSDWWWLFVKGFHVLEFAALTWLLLRASGGLVAMCALTALGFAALDEWHQTFVPGRGGLASDAAIDALGVLLALGLWRLRGSKRPPTP